MIFEVTLTKKQYNELMKPVEGEGGFQSHLRQLQNQASMRYAVHLSPGDLRRLYASVGTRGGFQARMRKVFDFLDMPK